MMLVVNTFTHHRKIKCEMEKSFFRLSELPMLDIPDEKFDVRFIHTRNITVAFSTLIAGAVVPLHAHVHETIDFVQEGELEMRVGELTVRLHASMVFRVPPGVVHSARAITDCKVINIFYPAREDFQSRN